MNMNCNEIKSQVHEFVGTEAATTCDNDIRQHLSHCNSCNQYFIEHQQLQQILSGLPRHSAPSTLADRIRVQRQTRQQKHSRLNIGFAFAASIVIIAITTSILFKPVDRDAYSSKIFTTLNKPSQVNFLVESKHAINHVTFSLSVPPELELYGYGGTQTLSWLGKLKKGKNLLSVPVVALKQQQSTLIMEIKHDLAIKKYKVFIDVKFDKVQLMFLPDRTLS